MNFLIICDLLLAEEFLFGTRHTPVRLITSTWYGLSKLWTFIKDKIQFIRMNIWHQDIIAHMKCTLTIGGADWLAFVGDVGVATFSGSDCPNSVGFTGCFSTIEWVRRSWFSNSNPDTFSESLLHFAKNKIKGSVCSRS